MGYTRNIPLLLISYFIHLLCFQLEDAGTCVLPAATRQLHMQYYIVIHFILLTFAVSTAAGSRHVCSACCHEEAAGHL